MKQRKSITRLLQHKGEPRQVKGIFMHHGKSKLSLNSNELKSKYMNSPIKRYQPNSCIKKHDSSICRLQETHFMNKVPHKVEMKRWKRY